MQNLKVQLEFNEDYEVITDFIEEDGIYKCDKPSMDTGYIHGLDTLTSAILVNILLSETDKD